MPYRAPLSDYSFLLDHILGYDRLAATPRFDAVPRDTATAILAQAARLCEDSLVPLNRIGDRHPAHLDGGITRTPPGFAEAYHAIAQGGWIGMAARPDHGGMGLPLTLATCVNEMMSAACLALQLNPLLTQGQIEALEHHATPALRALYLPKLISGAWSGTMNLTEPQAGSDVGALRSKAEPNPDGSFAITGQKIYITWGDADFIPNICHLVLARLPDAAPGSAGISLFLVPKFLPDAGGNPGQRNRITTVSLEHKLGLHGSPTCVLHYDGATGWLVGEPHKGLSAMFTMMNNARLGVAAQGIGIAEAAFQQALAYARTRQQGRTPTGHPTIIDHADIRRMLATMRAQLFSARAIALSCAHALDMATATGAPEWQARAALLTPIAKAYGTDTGQELAHMGIQIHGGMGVIEETGAAQYARDVRVTTIYEGTNGIQAMDLTARKMADGGTAAFALMDEVQSHAESARAAYPDLAHDLWQATEALRETTEALIRQDLTDRFAGAVPYLRAFALILGADAHLRAAHADATRAPLARIALRRLLPDHMGLLVQARLGAADLYALDPDALHA